MNRALFEASYSSTYEVLIILSTFLSFNTCITLFLSKYLGFGYTSHTKLPSQVSFCGYETRCNKACFVWCHKFSKKAALLKSNQGDIWLTLRKRCQIWEDRIGLLFVRISKNSIAGPNKAVWITTSAEIQRKHLLGDVLTWIALRSVTSVHHNDPWTLHLYMQNKFM